MTVVAWDKHCLAVDSRFTSGNRKYNGQKFKVIDDGTRVVVFAGEVRAGRKAIRLLEAGKPLTDAITKAATILVFNFLTAELTTYEDGPAGELVKEVDAWGSGSDFAIGALEAGVWAETAVKIACKYHNECGGKIHVFK